MANRPAKKIKSRTNNITKGSFWGVALTWSDLRNRPVEQKLKVIVVVVVVVVVQ